MDKDESQYLPNPEDRDTDLEKERKVIDQRVSTEPVRLVTVG